LTPIPITRTPITSEPSPSAQDGQPSGLRGRVEQQVDAIAGSANKVISGVVDSLGMLRLLLPNPVSPDPTSPPGNTMQSSAPWNVISPRFGLLRRETSFSIASLAASLPGSGARANPRSTPSVMEGQPLLAVSRPSSVKSGHRHGNEHSFPPENNEEWENDGKIDQSDDKEGGEDHDTGSIQNFETTMNGKTFDRKVGVRRSLSDRFANMSGLGRLQAQEYETLRASIS